MIIQGTEKIRGALNISRPKMELKRDQVIRISEADYNSPDMQTALGRGLIKVIEDSSSNKSKVPRIKAIFCRSVHNKTITVSALPQGIKPGEEVALTPEQFDSADIQTALGRGYLEVINSADANESTISVKLTKLQAEVKSRPPQQDNGLETNEEISTPCQVIEAPKGLKAAVIWGQKEPAPVQKIDTVEEVQKRNIMMPSDVIDTPDPEPVKSEDKKGSSIIWNPSNNPVMNQMKNAVIGGPKGNQDITFVDKEQDEARHQSHPLLKNIPVKSEEELGFADEIEQEQRINAHPVLKNKPQAQSGEVDFVTL